MHEEAISLIKRILRNHSIAFEIDDEKTFVRVTTRDLPPSTILYSTKERQTKEIRDVSFKLAKEMLRVAAPFGGSDISTNYNNQRKRTTFILYFRKNKKKMSPPELPPDMVTILEEFRPSKNVPDRETFWRLMQIKDALDHREYVRGVYDVYDSEEWVARYVNLDQNKNLYHIYKVFPENMQKYLTNLEIRIRRIEDSLYPMMYSTNPSEKNRELVERIRKRDLGGQSGDNEV